MIRSVTTNKEPPVHVYARLLRHLHELIARGLGDSPEAEALADEMDAPGYALTESERDRVSGLSEDLYALAEGRVNAVPMPASERDQWDRDFQNAIAVSEWDRVLQLLRRPPRGLAAGYVPSMQAKCWKAWGIQRLR